MSDPEHNAFAIIPLPISDYAHHRCLPEIETDMAAVVQLLEEFGGVELRWDAEPPNRHVDAVYDRLDQWANHQVPRSSVIVWLGHGESQSNGAWLAAQDTLRPMRRKGLKPKDLAEYVEVEWRHRASGTEEWTIVVIDACGADTFARLLFKELSTHNGPDRLAIIPAGGDGASYVGHFRQALDSAMRSYTINDEVVDVYDLVSRIGARLVAGRVMTIGLHGPLTVRRRRLVEATAMVSLDTYAILKAFIDDLPEDKRDRFIPRALGGELKELAWHFAGRHGERATISRWLRERSSGMLALTGPPGSGKSALLGYLLVLANRGLRDLLRQDGQLQKLDAAQLPPADAFDAVVHLTGLTTDGVVNRLAVAAGLPEPAPTEESGHNVEWLIDQLGRRCERFTVLADALDEAKEPFVIAGSVLRRIAALPHIRVVVGCRTSTRHDPDRAAATDDLLEALGGVDATEVPVPHDDVAIKEYVRHRLDAAGIETLVGVDEYAVEQAVTLIAGTGRPFLFAQLAVHELVARPELVKPSSRSQLIELLDTDHHGLFETAASRLAAKSAFALPLLEALALARGRGLPRANGIWAIAASALAGRKRDAPVTADAGEVDPQIDAQIDELLVAAAPYIMLDAEDGRSVYRLAHRTFQDYFLERLSAPGLPGSSEADRHRLVAGALLDAAKRFPSVAASHYLVRYLAEHVARADVWHALAAEPHVLDCLDPDAVAAEVLRTAFGRVDLPDEVAAVAAARQTLSGVASGDRAPIRAVAMARHTDAVPPAEVSSSCWWRWGWAQVRRDPISVVLAGHKGLVTAMTPVSLPDGRVLLATASSDHSVRLWDPTTGQPTGPPLIGQAKTIRAVASVTVPGRSVVASVSSDGSVWLWNAVTCQPVHRGLRGEGWPFTTVGSAEVDDVTLLVTGGADGVLRFWDPTTGLPARTPLVAHASEVTTVFAVRLKDRALLASGGRDGTISLWDLDEQTEIDVTFRRLAGRTNSLCIITQPDGRTVLLAAGNEALVARWDVLTGEPVDPQLTGHGDWVNALTPIRRPDGLHILASAGSDKGVRLWDLSDGRSDGILLTGHDQPVRTVVSIELPDGRTVLASGGDDRTVRLWVPDLRRPALDTRHRYAGPVQAIATTRTHRGSDLLVTGTRAGVVQRWDPATGGLIGYVDTTREWPVSAVAAVTLPDGRPVVAVGGDLSVWLWSPGGEWQSRAADRMVSKRLDGHTRRVTALAAAVLPDGRALIASGSDDTTVRLWNAATGRPVGQPLTRHKTEVTAIAAAVSPDGQLVLATASQGGDIRIWHEISPGEMKAKPRIVETGQASAVSLLPLADGRMLVAAGGKDTMVRLWDSTDARIVGVPLRGHSREVTAIAPLRLPDGRTLLATGGIDATIRLWDPIGCELLYTLPLGQPVRSLAAMDTRLIIGSELGLLALDLDPAAVRQP